MITELEKIYSRGRLKNSLLPIDSVKNQGKLKARFVQFIQ
jgi:hypothetical protein